MQNTIKNHKNHSSRKRIILKRLEELTGPLQSAKEYEWCKKAVQENIETGLQVSKQKSIPEDIFSLFPVLHEMRHRKGGNLSGGQQQQLAIARALVTNPKVLLLDEPTEGIQPSIIKDIARVLNEIRQMREITIVVSEQVLSFTMDIADRIMVIEKSNLIHEDLRENVDAAKIKQYLTV